MDHYYLATVTATDITPPVISNCPASARYELPFGSRFQTVSWTEPTASDNSGNIPIRLKSHSPGGPFPIGVTQVGYIFLDMAGNEASCSFTITGKECSLWC